MEIKVSRTSVPVRSVLMDVQQEHDFSQSIVLPDYEPEIFRVISCEAVPFVTDYRLSGGRLTYELCIRLRVIYCGEETASLCCASQNVTVSRTIDMPEESGIEVRIYPETSYQTCRAAGKRRLDVRGAAAVRVKAFVNCEQQVVTGYTIDEDSPSAGLQLKKENITTVSAVRRAVRNISLSENITVSSGKPVLSVLRCSASVSKGECSVIAGKLVARGELTADILMKTGTEENSIIESMRAAICPFSQIVDMDGIDESFSGIADMDITEFDVKPAADPQGTGTLTCSAELRLTCSAVKTGNIPVVTDAYSTRYSCNCVTEKIRVSGEPVQLDESFVLSCDIRSGDKAAQEVCDLCCRLRNVSIESLPAQGKLRVTGMLGVNVLVCSESGGVTLTEREEAFEELVSLGMTADDFQLFAWAEPYQSSYHLGADGSLSVKCSVRLHGNVCSEIHTDAVTDIILLTDSPSENDRACALRIYYGTAGESIWDIAKRAGTRAEAVILENGLEGEVLKKSGMLLIPVVH